MDIRRRERLKRIQFLEELHGTGEIIYYFLTLVVLGYLPPGIGGVAPRAQSVDAGPMLVPLMHPEVFGSAGVGEPVL